MNAEREERIRQLFIRMENFAMRLVKREREKAAAAVENFPVRESDTTSTRVLMSLPTSYDCSIPLDTFMEEWMNEQQDFLSQTIVEPHDQNQQENKLQSISFAYHNASGKKGKIHNLNDCLHWTIYDMILIAETWYDDSIDTKNIIAGTNFDLYRRDRGSNGGGVIMAIRNEIRVNSCKTWINFKLIEAITACITDENITLIYWPPFSDKRDKDASINELTILLTNLKRISSRNVIIGDFNLTGIHWTYNKILEEMTPSTVFSNTFEKTALAILEEFGYQQKTIRPNPNGWICALSRILSM